jgi:nicotinamidase-related amidase
MKFVFAAVLLLLSVPTLADGTPPTLLALSGVQPQPGQLSGSVLVVIDAQREYVDGALPLDGIDHALAAGKQLLARARAAGTPVIHVMHRGNGVLFDPAGPYFAVAAPLAPNSGEAVIEKRLPNAFAGTSLQQILSATGRTRLIVIGFMTHMCVSSTVRAALDLGYATTVVADATATRDLPDGHGGAISAATVQLASLAALADRFAIVVNHAGEIAD